MDGPLTCDSFAFNVPSLAGGLLWEEAITRRREEEEEEAKKVTNLHSCDGQFLHFVLFSLWLSFLEKKKTVIPVTVVGEMAELGMCLRNSFFSSLSCWDEREGMFNLQLTCMPFAESDPPPSPLSLSYSCSMLPSLVSTHSEVSLYVTREKREGEKSTCVVVLVFLSLSLSLFTVTSDLFLW